MARNVTTSDTPQDRLGRVIDAAMTAIEAHPEYREGDRVLIMAHDRTTMKGGNAGLGFEDAEEVMATMMEHAEAFAKSQGFPFRLLPIDSIGEG